MANRLEDKIEILGLSSLACAELRKSGVNTVQDLMILINRKLVSEEKNSMEISMQSVSLRTAVLEVVKEIGSPFNIDEVRDKMHIKYGDGVSTKKNSVNTVLNELLRKGVIKRIDTSTYVFYAEIKRSKYKPKIDSFLEDSFGKEIEFRYKTERPSSDKRWRCETVWAYDEQYLYVKKQYSSGRHVAYLKSRIVDYRMKRKS